MGAISHTPPVDGTEDDRGAKRGTESDTESDRDDAEGYLSTRVSESEK